MQVTQTTNLINKTLSNTLNIDSALNKRVNNLLNSYRQMWWALDTSLPSFTKQYSKNEQKQRDNNFNLFQQNLTNEIENQPKNETERNAARERLFSNFDNFARSSLDFKDNHLNVILSEGFTQTTIEFVKKSRHFDSSLSDLNIFQAIRNVWAMNSLQFMMGKNIELTPAIFAYSLLYPYTDNFLDSPDISEMDKKDFNDRLALRLAGHKINPTIEVEHYVYKLVSLIEGQYNRQDFPSVFESLLTIHSAQIKSLNLLKSNITPYEIDVLGISIEKGGTSVLADGYLIAGTLTKAEQDFMFGCGAYLQFMDDLRDVADDHKNGLHTIFSKSAAHWPLDSITNKTFRFGTEVLKRMECFDSPETAPLKELLQKTTSMLLIDAIGSADNLFTKQYIKNIESHSPFSFSFLKKRKKKFSNKKSSLMFLIDAFID